MKRLSLKGIDIQHWNLEKLTKYFLVLGVIAALVGTHLWYGRIYMTDERRFWAAVDRAMAINSVTRRVEDGGTGNKQINQTRLVFSPMDFMQNKTTITERSSTSNSEVVTDGYVTLREQMLRYSKIETSQKRVDGSDFDFRSVVGKWASDSDAEENPEILDERRLNYLQEMIYLVPFGNFDKQTRSDMTARLRDAYSVNIDAVSTDVRDGVKYIDVPVTISTKKYVAVLRDAIQKAGLGDFPPLNPESYQDKSRVNAVFAINASTGNIAGISYNGRQEFYNDHGVYTELSLPQAEMTIGDLQGLIQTVQ